MANAQPNYTDESTDPAGREFLHHSHDAFLGALTSMAGLPSMIAQIEHARGEATSALTYFERHMLPHHATEEHILFPAVIRAARTQSERDHVLSLTGQLTAEHRNVEQLWLEIAPVLQAFVEGRSAPMDADLFSRLMRDYSRHVICEESEFLPMARTILGSVSSVPSRN